jgi:hypothetical protein
VLKCFVRVAPVLNLHAGGGGDLALCEDGRWAAVENLLDTGEWRTVYNLRVADSHT